MDEKQRKDSSQEKPAATTVAGCIIALEHNRPGLGKKFSKSITESVVHVVKQSTAEQFIE